ncbi:MAG: hypothetical protein HC787_01040, partial [Nostocaceae cyanobacterium CSU_2_110]|nr:hypothetical protein [Nostocaceae cyanobacterium CSU_2_110]
IFRYKPSNRLARCSFAKSDRDDFTVEKNEDCHYKKQNNKRSTNSEISVPSIDVAAPKTSPPTA